MAKLKLGKIEQADKETAINLETGEIESIAPKDEPKKPQEAKESKGGGKSSGKRQNGTNVLIGNIKEYLNERYSFRYNEILQSNEFFPTYGNSSQEDYEALEERAKNDLFLEMLEEGIAGSIKGLQGHFELIVKSSFVPTFNPVDEYFRGLKWDGVKRVDALVDTLDIEKEVIEWHYNGKDYSKGSVELLREYLPRWLMSCIRSGTAKGANNIVFGLQGNQKGSGKTWWLNHLCPTPLQNRYAYEGAIIPDITHRETGLILTQRFWTNIDDQLQNIFYKDSHSIKGVITSEKVTQRKMHKDDMPTRPRITNFVASVNPRSIFTESKNRRYLLIALNEKNQRPIDHEAYNKLDKDQIWAEMLVRYNSGESYTFGSKEFEAIAQWTSKFVIPSAEEEMLVKHFRPPTVAELEQDKAISYNENKPGHIRYLQKTELLSYLSRESGLKLYSRSLSTALDKCGFDLISKRIGGGNPRYVVPVVGV